MYQTKVLLKMDENIIDVTLTQQEGKSQVRKEIRSVLTEKFEDY